MSPFDIILLIILFSFLCVGFRLGAIHAFGGLLGTIAGVMLAGKYYLVVAEPVVNFFPKWTGVVQIVLFLFMFIIVNRIVGFIFYLLARAFHFLTEAPLLGFILRVGGMLFGLLEGVLVVGVTLFLTQSVDFPELLTSAITTSQVASRLIHYAEILTPLLNRSY